MFHLYCCTRIVGNLKTLLNMKRKKNMNEKEYIWNLLMRHLLLISISYASLKIILVFTMWQFLYSNFEQCTSTCFVSLTFEPAPLHQYENKLTFFMKVHFMKSSLGITVYQHMSNSSILHIAFLIILGVQRDRSTLDRIRCQ